jgi:hypothetical protein
MSIRYTHMRKLTNKRNKHCFIRDGFDCYHRAHWMVEPWEEKRSARPIYLCSLHLGPHCDYLYKAFYVVAVAI